MSEEHENEHQWLEPSNVGSEYMRHESAMLPAARVPVHKSFALAPGLNVGLLRQLAESYKPKKIAVIDHAESGFEVRRLADSANLALFYGSLDSEKLKEITASPDEKQLGVVVKVIKEFFESPDEAISKYDQRGAELRKAGCIGYTYMQRRLAAVSVFRKDSQGSAGALKKILSAMESGSLIRRLDKDEAQELFNTSSGVYRINKAAL